VCLGATIEALSLSLKIHNKLFLFHFPLTPNAKLNLLLIDNCEGEDFGVNFEEMHRMVDTACVVVLN
jgi:hypothetical protein